MIIGLVVATCKHIRRHFLRNALTIQIAILIGVLLFFGLKAFGNSASETPTQNNVVSLPTKVETTFTTTTTTVPLTTTTVPLTTKPFQVLTSKPEMQEPQSDIQNIDIGIWDRLAECESGGNWAIDTGNGYYGGLQFSLATWTRLHTHWGANSGYTYPHEAPREVQIEMATLLMQVSSGTHSQWPSCSRKIGMPNKF